MRVLLVSAPDVPEDLPAALKAGAERRGHAVHRFRTAEAGTLQPATGPAGPADDPVDHRHRLRTLDPDTLLMVTGTATDDLPASVRDWPFLTVWSMASRGQRAYQLRNLITGKVSRTTAATLDEALDIVEAEGLQRLDLHPGDQDAAGPFMPELAATRRRLAEAATAFPALAKVAGHPAVDVAGALESVAEDEVVAEDRLWLKGWVDLQDARYAGIHATVNGLRVDGALTGFRADIFGRGAVRTPTGFEIDVDLSATGARAEIVLWVSDHQGRSRSWLKRAVWVDRLPVVPGRTPLILGTASLEDGAIRCTPRSDRRRVRRVAAFQAGHCIGRGGMVSAAGEARELTFPVAPMERSGCLIHLHVTFDGLGPVAWLALDPGTGRPASEPGTGNDTDGAVVRDDRYWSDWLADATPGAICINGQRARLDRRDPDRPPVLDLADQPAGVVVEALEDGKRRRALRLWRLRGTALRSARLAAFVLPPATGPRPAQAAPAHAATASRRVLLLRQAAGPTDELYVLAPLSRLAAQRPLDLQIVDLGTDGSGAGARAEMLREGTTVIVSRYVSDAWLTSLTRHRPRLRDVFYLVDDDVTRAEDDSRMRPLQQRNRVVGTAHGAFAAMLQICTRLVVTSPALRQRFDSDRTDLLEPPYILQREAMTHLDRMDPVTIAYHGTPVHWDDLAAIAPALRRVHDSFANVRITTLMGGFTPPILHDCPRISILPEMPWSDYRAYVAESSAHIALAPMLNTPYNTGKSHVKIHDAARLGAVGLYSRRTPFEEQISHGEDGFLLENDPAVWWRTLAWLIRNPDEIRRTAANAQALALRIGDPDLAVGFWRDRLFPDGAGPT